MASGHAKPHAKQSDLTRTDEFITLQLGDSRRSIRVPIMPSIFAGTHDKAKCYDYFATQILSLHYIIPMAELITTYALHFPINTMSAENEAKTVANHIHKAFFNVANLEGQGFFDSHGKEKGFKENHASNCPASLDNLDLSLQSTQSQSTTVSSMMQLSPWSLIYLCCRPKLLTNNHCHERNFTYGTQPQ